MATAKVNLDEKDRGILRLLLKNPRLSTAEMARTLGVQRDTVRYRIERLEREGLIMKYHVILDPHALGYEIFVTLLIKAYPAPAEQTKSLLAKLAQHENITHVSRLVGAFDYSAQVVAKDI